MDADVVVVVAIVVVPVGRVDLGVIVIKLIVEGNGVVSEKKLADIDVCVVVEVGGEEGEVVDDSTGEEGVGSFVASDPEKEG